MSSIHEKRVHGANTDPAALFVASDIGLVRVAVVGERVGTIEPVHRCTARDLALTGAGVAVATDEDVLVVADGVIDGTGFGPATAVGFHDALLAAGPDGSVARRTADGWTDSGSAPEVRAIDGDLFGTAGGVYRLADGGLSYAGLDDACDVAAAGTPRAATAAGLYRLGNGWLDELDGDFSMVTADPATDRAHAATADRFYERDEGEWHAVEGVGSVIGVAYAGGVYVVTADGTLLVETDDGWREHPLGVGTARAVAARTDRKPV